MNDIRDKVKKKMIERKSVIVGEGDPDCQELLAEKDTIIAGQQELINELEYLLSRPPTSGKESLNARIKTLKERGDGYRTWSIFWFYMTVIFAIALVIEVFNLI